MSKRGEEDPNRPDDPYSRVNYRRLIAWEQRIAREAPFLLSLLDQSPERSVIDLGCGTGEHVTFFAKSDARAVGIDLSPAMIAAAKDYEATGQGRYLLGDVTEAPATLGDEPRFGLAICLGNVLPPHLTEDEELERFVASARDVLLPGGRLLIQILNYEKLRVSGRRYLPINIRPGDDGKEIVFLRLMSPVRDGRAQFFPSTLELDPNAEEPLRVTTSRRVEVRTWTRADLVPVLAAAGFDVVCYGDMAGNTFIEDESDDLVMVGARGGGDGNDDAPLRSERSD